MYNEATHHNEIDLDKIDINTEEPIRQYYFMAKCREWDSEKILKGEEIIAN